MLTILIPAYNEENILEISVNKIFKKLYQFENKFQVLVINNNSNDKTENVCMLLQTKYDKFFFINEPLQGKGNAIKSGLKNALYNLRYIRVEVKLKFINYVIICVFLTQAQKLM